MKTKIIPILSILSVLLVLAIFTITILGLRQYRLHKKYTKTTQIALTAIVNGIAYRKCIKNNYKNLKSYSYAYNECNVELKKDIKQEKIWKSHHQPIDFKKILDNKI